MRKEQGGMGFRDLHFFNLAMLGKHGWNFVSNLHTLANRLIKAKYFPHGNLIYYIYIVQEGKGKEIITSRCLHAK